MSNIKKKMVYGLLGIFTLTLSVAFNATSQELETRSKYQGEGTGNCYCNIKGVDCACVG